MKKSEILKKAKRNLWDGKNEDSFWHDGKEKFICLAISRVVGGDSRVHNELKRWIHDDLLCTVEKDYASLEDWLQLHHPEFVFTKQRVQQLRRKWIDYMISYWESKGE